jgi:hypothetical protein
MRRSLVVLAAALVVIISAVAGPAAAQHIVPAEAAQARLAEAAAQRAHQLAVVDAVLASPEAEAAASSLGQDTRRLRAVVPALGDSELRDLAARAEALQADPVAGLDSDIRQLLVIFLIVAIVILVLQAVD